MKMSKLFVAGLLLTCVLSAHAEFDEGALAYKKQDYATALQEWRQLAAQGDAYAQYNVGLMYYRGEGVNQNYTEAMKWFRKAAEQGDANAQHAIGKMYREGSGLKQDYAEAMLWSRKAADQGDASAQFNIGGMYYEGEGVKQNYTEAMKWWSKAAAQGHVVAQRNIGAMYYKGQGVKQSYSEALQWYCKAAEQGDVLAQLNVGGMYDKGEGVPQDTTKAIEWWKKAAAGGNEVAKKKLQSVEVTAKQNKYVKKLQAKYGDIVLSDSAEAMAIVWSFKIDCQLEDRRVLPLINLLYATAEAHDAYGTEVRYILRNQGKSVRIYDAIYKNGKSLRSKEHELELTFEINEWGELRPFGITKESILNACIGSQGRIWEMPPSRKQ